MGSFNDSSWSTFIAGIQVSAVTVFDDKIFNGWAYLALRLLADLVDVTRTLPVRATEDLSGDVVRFVGVLRQMAAIKVVGVLDEVRSTVPMGVCT